jgi:Na+/H+-dicarboxylate symporter
MQGFLECFSIVLCMIFFWHVSSSSMLNLFNSGLKSVFYLFNFILDVSHLVHFADFFQTLWSFNDFQYQHLCMLSHFVFFFIYSYVVYW